jgi:hypothetical protein
MLSRYAERGAIAPAHPPSPHLAGDRALLVTAARTGLLGCRSPVGRPRLVGIQHQLTFAAGLGSLWGRLALVGIHIPSALVLGPVTGCPQGQA